MIAKRGKGFSHSDEANFFHALYYKCFKTIVLKDNCEMGEVKVVLGFLDFINLYLSSTKDKSREFIQLAIHDHQTVIRCKFSPIMKNPLYKDSFKKRWDELRHYLNYEFKKENSDDVQRQEEGKDQHKAIQVKD